MAYFQSDNPFFKLFQDHVRQELRTALTPVIEQVVNTCIDKAIDSMDVTHHTYYDHDGDGLEQVIKIITEKK